MKTRRVDGSKLGASPPWLLLPLVVLAVGAFASGYPRGGRARTCEVRTRGVHRGKPSASLQRLLLMFVLLSVGVLATGCIRAGEASVSEPTGSRPAMAIEVPSAGDVRLPFRIAGWAVDLGAKKGTGVDLVEVLDKGCEGTVIGIATYGIDRPDVADSFGPQFAPSGWQLLVETLSPGRYALGVRARSTLTSEFNQCQSLSVNVK